MIRFLIFDLDGTLADTSRDIADSINFALDTLGAKRYTVEEIKSMVGSGITSLLRSLILSGPQQDTVEFKNAARRFLDYYEAHMLDNTVVYPGVQDTLLKLKRYRKAVLSNKREGFSRKILEALGILDVFDAVYGSDSLSEKKPSPVPIQEILQRFSVYADEAMIIGDSSFDIEAGRAAGVRSIAVTYGFRSRAELTNADFIIDRFSDLLEVLENIDLHNL